MKIVIILYYDIKDYFLSITKHFQNYGYDVDFYPLYRYSYDVNDKIDNYKEHMNEFIKKTSPNYLLWWFIDVPVDVFKFIKENNPKLKLICYNSDDPLNYGPLLIEKFKKVDFIGTNCNNSVRGYKTYCGVRETYFMPMGYDDDYFFPQDNFGDNSDSQNKYDCDISIICPIIYHHEHYAKQYINHKELLDRISEFSKVHNKKFVIYGPPWLRELFPDNYSPELPYIEQNNIYNKSKINIVIHPNCQVDLPVSDRVFTVLGSGGLLMIDKFKDSKKMFVHNKNCVVINKDKLEFQILEILDNYDKYMEIKKNGHELSKNYTWLKWVETIHISITKSIFDYQSYAKLNGIDDESIKPISSDKNKLWEHWLNNKKLICYKMDIPDSFDSESYCEDYNLHDRCGKDVELLFHHWFNNGKKQIYLKKNKSRGGNGNIELNFDFDENKLITEEVFKLYNLLNKIKNSTNNQERRKQINKLSIFIQNRPYLNMNELLSKYLDFIN